MIELIYFFDLYPILYWIPSLSVMLNVIHNTENQSVHLFRNKSSFSKTWKWGSQSLLERIASTWILMKNLTEQPLYAWGSEPGTKPVQSKSVQLITWLWDSARRSNTKVYTRHTRPSDKKKKKKGHNFIRVQIINKRNILKHKTESSQLWEKGNSSDGR